MQERMGEFVNIYEQGGRLRCLVREGDRIREITKSAEYCAFYRVADISPELKRSMEGSRHIRYVRQEGEFYRVSFRDAYTRKILLWGTREGGSPLTGIPVFEGDVHPVRRFLSDNDVSIQRPRVAYLDLETDSRVPFSRKEQATILSWAVVDPTTGESFSDVLEEFSTMSERGLLYKLFDVLDRFDLVSAWNGEGFDFPVLQSRVRVTGTSVNLRRWLWLDHLELFKRMNTASESGDEKSSLKLNDVAQTLVGEGKDEFDASKTWEAWEAGGDERLRLERYNVQDTALLAKIEAKTGYMELFFTLCDVCRVLPETRGLNPTTQMDGFMLQLGSKEGVRFPTKKYDDDVARSYDGAFVLHPEVTGIEKGVHVADFASLYPSIIVSWNMSPDTKVAAPVNGPIADGLCRAPKTGVSFSTRKIGILPKAILTLIQKRSEWNDRKAALPPGTPEWKAADRYSTSYKVATNSFYGVIGNAHSRYYDRSIAESVTQSGVWLIEETIAHARARGWRVIYADTDSLFVTGVSELEFGQFVKQCNEHLYPQLLAKHNCAKEYFRIKLAYEKEFERIVFTSAKRYCGRYTHYKGTRATKDSKPEVRGLEYRRGDTALLARQMQYEVIEALMKGEERAGEFEVIVEKWIAKILQGELLLEEVVMSKALSRDLSDYATKVKKDGTDAADLIHVQVAKQMEARGVEVREGTRIHYVVTDEGPPMKAVSASEYDGTNADRYYYWEKAVYPPTMRLLAAAFPHHPAWALYEKQRPRGNKNQLRLF